MTVTELSARQTTDRDAWEVLLDPEDSDPIRHWSGASKWFHLTDPSIRNRQRARLRQRPFTKAEFPHYSSDIVRNEQWFEAVIAREPPIGAADVRQLTGGTVSTRAELLAQMFKVRAMYHIGEDNEFASIESIRFLARLAAREFQRGGREATQSADRIERACQNTLRVAVVSKYTLQLKSEVLALTDVDRLSGFGDVDSSEGRERVGRALREFELTRLIAGVAEVRAKTGRLPTSLGEIVAVIPRIPRKQTGSVEWFYYHGKGVGFRISARIGVSPSWEWPVPIQPNNLL